MFTWRVRDPFGSFAVSCVKLPAAVAFPTDDRLLKRLEESRRALPPNSVKALRGRHSLACSAMLPSPRVRDGVRSMGADLPAETQTFPARDERWTLPKTVHIEDVYARSRVAVGQR